MIVDELDRCLPSYAIKVLERLHHLFAEVENTAVILAVDKSQLRHTVKQIFGSDTDTTKYLKKFIDFEVQLAPGRIVGGFFEKYADYIALFDCTLIQTQFSFEKFFSAIFAGIDVRTQEQIMERIKTIHCLLFRDTKKDYAFMCMEVLWVVFTEYHNFTSSMPIMYDESYEKHCFTLTTSKFPEFSEYLEKEWTLIGMRQINSLGNRKPTSVFETPLDIPQILVWYLWQMYPFSNRYYQIEQTYPRLAECQNNLIDLKKFDTFLKIVV